MTPSAAARVRGIAIHPLTPYCSRNHDIRKVIAVEMIIRILSSALREVKTPIGRTAEGFLRGLAPEGRFFLGDVPLPAFLACSCCIRYVSYADLLYSPRGEV